MKSNQTPFKFNLGDYVAERPRLYGSCATTEQGLGEYKKRDFQRYGRGVDRIILKDKRGARRKYIKVKWSHNNTVSVHEQMRLCAAKDIEAITNATRELIDF